MARYVRFPFRSYDGGLPFCPAPRPRGSLVLRETGWELLMPHGGARGSLARYRLRSETASPGSCRVVIEDRLDPTVVARVDLPRTPKATFDSSLGALTRAGEVTSPARFRVVAYDGRSTAHPVAEESAELVLVRLSWMLLFPGGKRLQGDTVRTSFAAVPTGPTSCQVSVTGDGATQGAWTFGLPDTAAQVLRFHIDNRRHMAQLAAEKQATARELSALGKARRLERRLLASQTNDRARRLLSRTGLSLGGLLAIFLLLFAVFGLVGGLVLVPHHSGPATSIGAVANAHLPVLSPLAQHFVRGSPADPTRSGWELALLLAAAAAAMLVFPVPLVRWLVERMRGIVRLRSARPLVALFAAGPFAAGYFGGWPYGIVLAGAGLVLAGIPLAGARAASGATTFWAGRRLPGVGPATGRRATAAILAVSFSLVPAAFDGLGAMTGTIVRDLPSDVVVHGYAVVNAPLVDAAVHVYRLGPDGRPSVLLATAVTNRSGFYAATVSVRPHDTLLVETAGGSYTDEVTKHRVFAGHRDSLQAVLAGGPGNLSLTPLSTFSTERALALARSGVPLPAAAAASYAAVARQFGLPTVTGVEPDVVDVPAADQGETSYPSREIGLVLAGLDEEAAGLGAADFGLSDSIAADLSDGDLDGRDGTAPVLLPDGAPLPADATTTVLQHAIDSFAASPGNDTGLPPPQISPSPCTIKLSAGALYVTAPSAITFVEGRPGAVGIETNGPKPYTCSLAGGALGDGFALAPDCFVTYDGRPVLGSSVEYVSTPFSVRVTDGSSPPQSVAAADLRITVLHAPPTVAGPGTAHCRAAPAACFELLATAGGGVPPYTFDIASGTLPLGLQLQTINSATSIRGPFGNLVGDQAWVKSSGSRAFPDEPLGGSYRVEVCAVDSIGSAGCAPKTVVVDFPTYQPPPTSSSAPLPSTTVPGPTGPTGPAPATLPPGFPTGLPSGTYGLQLCQVYVGCVAATSVTAGDEAQLADTLQQVVDAAAQACGAESGCSYSYSPWNGSTFTLTVYYQGEQDLQILVTYEG